MPPNGEPENPTICAIVCIRNESKYLTGLISHLKAQGIDIVFIDNESTDGSREIIEKHIGSGVISLRNLAYNGSFSLSDQLQAKAEVEQTLTHDWILHLDADEIPHASSNNLTLLNVCKRAAREGYNVINFEEFVFLPSKDHNSDDENAHLSILRYYYFAPMFHRLMRLYRRGQGLDNRSGAGHRIHGNAIIYPQTQVLRHYITLDQNHLNSKYLGRVFDEKELKKGWHGNRIGLTDEVLSLSRMPHDKLEYLPNPSSREFLRNRLIMGISGVGNISLIA